MNFDTKLILRGTVIGITNNEGGEFNGKKTEPFQTIQFLIKNEKGKIDTLNVKDKNFINAEIGKEITLSISISCFNNNLYYKTIKTNK